MRISATLAWATPVLALAVTAGAYAQEPEKATAPVATATTATAASMIVVRDKETGALRAATPEEAERLISSGRNAQVFRAPIEPREIRARAGTRAMNLGDAGMSTQIARKNAQGGIDEICVEGADAAAKVMSTPATAKVTAHE